MASNDSRDVENGNFSTFSFRGKANIIIIQYYLIRRTETRGFPDVVLTTDSWSTLVRLCGKRISDEPDSVAKRLQQNATSSTP